MNKHVVWLDTVSNGEKKVFKRIICLGAGCRNACTVRQTWVTDEGWRILCEMFSKKHPSARIRIAGDTKNILAAQK